MYINHLVFLIPQNYDRTITNMDDTQKMLRAIISGQSSFRQEVLSKIDKLDKKLTGRIDGVEKNLTEKIDRVENRLDKIGKSLAYLEDDTPTKEEFDNLEKRVDRMERKTAP